MDVSSAKWLSDELGMDEYNIIHKCHMDSPAELTSQQDITTALGGSLKQSFSSESYSSYPISTTKYTTTTFGASSNEKSQTSFESHAKLIKTNSWNSSTTTDHESSKNSSASQLLSFQKSNSPATNPNQSYNCSLKPKVEGAPPRNIYLPQLVSKNSFESQNYAKENNHGTKRSYSMTRTPSLSQDHIMAERKRREKLSQHFIALSAIVPGLKKLDKASVLGDAIKYVKELQERVKFLEEQTKKRTVESVLFVKKSQVSTDDESSSCDDNSESMCGAALPEIEARVSDNDVLIRIYCEKQKGLLPKIISEVEILHLSIVNSNVLPFGNSTLDITIISQKNAEFCLTMKDLVKDLRSEVWQKLGCAISLLDIFLDHIYRCECLFSSVVQSAEGFWLLFLRGLVVFYVKLPTSCKGIRAA